MDVKLESLIEKIKQEGVDEAEQAAAAIVEKAEQEAKALRERARQESERIVEEARGQARKFQENAEQALHQAARDVVLQLKEQITALFDRVFKQEVGRALSPEFVEKMILSLVTEWAKDGQVEITVNEADKQQLEALLFTHLKAELKNAVTLRASHTVSKGFRIELKGESAYYDFTAETLSDALKAFINPSLQTLLDGSDG